MKTEIIEPYTTFKPVTLKLTFETEREYLFFKALLANASFQDSIDLANKYTDGFFNDNDIDVMEQIYLTIR